MGEDGELGVQQIVRLANGYLDREPAARRSNVRYCDSILVQPAVDGRDASRSRSDVRLGL